jgi:hypothetical protein
VIYSSRTTAADDGFAIKVKYIRLKHLLPNDCSLSPSAHHGAGSLASSAFVVVEPQRVAQLMIYITALQRNDGSAARSLPT